MDVNILASAIYKLPKFFAWAIYTFPKLFAWAISESLATNTAISPAALIAH